MLRVSSRPARMGVLLVVALIVLVLDQLSKMWIAANLSLNGTQSLIEEFLRLRYTRNTGAAFGLFQGWTGALSIVALAIIAVIVLSASRSGSGGSKMVAALGLVLGGAFGNLADRLALGYVRDFIEVYNPQVHLGNKIYTFPVFNVADSAITVGVVIIMGLLLFSQEHRPAVKEPEESTVTAPGGAQSNRS